LVFILAVFSSFLGHQMGRKCCCCGQDCGSFEHRIREQDLETIRQTHVTDPDLLRKVKVKARICCHHFEMHDHSPSYRGNIQLKTTFCAPAHFPSSLSSSFTILKRQRKAEDQNEDQKRRKLEEQEQKVNDIISKQLPSLSSLPQISQQTRLIPKILSSSPDIHSLKAELTSLHPNTKVMIGDLMSVVNNCQASLQLTYSSFSSKL
jgi:hypothetical protein